MPQQGNQHIRIFNCLRSLFVVLHNYGGGGKKNTALMYDSGQVHMEITAKADNHLLKHNLRDAMWASEKAIRHCNVIPGCRGFEIWFIKPPDVWGTSQFFFRSLILKTEGLELITFRICGYESAERSRRKTFWPWFMTFKLTCGGVSWHLLTGDQWSGAQPFNKKEKTKEPQKSKNS